MKRGNVFENVQRFSNIIIARLIVSQTEAVIKKETDKQPNKQGIVGWSLVLTEERFLDGRSIRIGNVFLVTRQISEIFVAFALSGGSFVTSDIRLKKNGDSRFPELHGLVCRLFNEPTNSRVENTHYRFRQSGKVSSVSPDANDIRPCHTY